MQGLEQVNAYEEQQRQDIAAEEDAHNMTAEIIEPSAELKMVWSNGFNHDNSQVWSNASDTLCVKQN